MDPDILYVVRPDERNEALRYSLRSLANLPHRRVFIAGYCPEWVRGVTVISVRRRANKFDSIEENVRRGLEHPELSEDLVYFNDDFYITQPVDTIPLTHGGLIDQYLGKQELKMRMRNTLAHLKECFPNMVFYTFDGIHTPLPLERGAARRALTNIPRGCLWRTWYGNSQRVGGIAVEDTKIRNEHTGDLGIFVSTGARGLRNIREQLDDLLPERSPYVY